MNIHSGRFSSLVENYPSISAELEAVIGTPKIDTVVPEPKFKHLKETLLHIDVFLSNRQDFPGSQRETIIEFLAKRGFPPALANSSHAKESGKILTAVTAVTSYASSIFRHWNKKEQEDFIAAEAHRLLETTSDAHFLVGLGDLLVMEPVLGDIISQTITMATDHLSRHVEKSVNILVGKAVQIQQDVLKEELRLTTERTLIESSRESLRNLRAEMERETPSAP
jgi:hypothetical protein